jgi:60 kDa SS-A/Ro ribonucleoprotein
MAARFARKGTLLFAYSLQYFFLARTIPSEPMVNKTNMKTNKKTSVAPVYTHEGARASRVSAQQNLSRSVMACLLWEDTFYEAGEDIATRIANLVKQNDGAFVAQLAIKAREEMKLRHVPLLLVREMARNPDQKGYVADTLARVIQRADELAEFLSIYWKTDKNQPLAAQVKKGLARAFAKFDEFALSRYNRDADVKLRDVLFLCHAKPEDAKGRGKKVEAVKTKTYARGEVLRHSKSVFTRLVNDELKVPDTWETELSAGKDKKATFERLIKENKLGALALLRNLRGMTEAGVDRKVITGALESMKTERVLPFRFIAAARYASQFEPQLESAMFKCLEGAEKLAGTTKLLVDVSGSMNDKISSKSDLTRIDAACGLAILLREICEHVEVYTFSNRVVEVPARRGFALRDAINSSQAHGGTELGSALTHLKYGMGVDRLIVISDEQSHDQVGSPKTKGYMLNVACDQNGVGYGAWNHVDGWSDAIVRFIVELEKSD